jgi:hypothetical protein
MKTRTIVFAELALLVCLDCIGFAQSEVKLAQTGFDFLSVISDARAAGMAGAVNSVEMGSGSLFFNPASLSQLKCDAEATVSLNTWIADIKHMQVTAAANLGSLGVVGLSVQSVNYGEFLLTVVDPNPNSLNGYIDMGSISLQAFSAGIGYARQLSDQFSVGAHIKYVHQDLGSGIVPASMNMTDSTTVRQSFKLNPLAFDFGTLYKTGLKSLAFGMSVRHFSGQVQYVQEGFQLPLIFTLGLSMDVMDFWANAKRDHSLIVSIDATHDRSYPEQLLVGMNYCFMNTLSLRAGYISNDDLEKFSYGFGISQSGLSLDYAYTPYSFFGSVQRITARLKM